VSKINRRPLRHNHTTLGILALLAIALTGCSGDKASQDQQPVGTRAEASSCQAVVTDHALAGFYQWADRIEAGEEPTVDDLSRLASQPAWDRWCRSFEPNVVPASHLGRTVFIALRGREELPFKLRDKSYRLDTVSAYEINLELRPQIEQFITDFAAAELACDVHRELQGWVPAELMPDTLYVDFVSSVPEIRFYEDHFMIDGGMALAAGKRQIVRSMSSVLYRQRMTVDGLAPDKAVGHGKVAQCMRLVYNEAIPAHIEELTELAFDPRHGLLAHAAAIPEDLANQAILTLGSMNKMLARLKDMPAPSEEQWQDVYRLFVGAQSWQPTGWFMAEVITNQLGEQGLRNATRSIPDFMAAYQEACSMQPARPTAEPGTLEWYFQSAPKLSPEVATWMDGILREAFPQE